MFLGLASATACFGGPFVLVGLLPLFLPVGFPFLVLRGSFPCLLLFCVFGVFRGCGLACSLLALPSPSPLLVLWRLLVQSVLCWSLPPRIWLHLQWSSCHTVPLVWHVVTDGLLSLNYVGKHQILTGLPFRPNAMSYGSLPQGQKGLTLSLLRLGTAGMTLSEQTNNTTLNILHGVRRSDLPLLPPPPTFSVRLPLSLVPSSFGRHIIFCSHWLRWCGGPFA